MATLERWVADLEAEFAVAADGELELRGATARATREELRQHAEAVAAVQQAHREETEAYETEAAAALTAHEQRRSAEEQQHQLASARRLAELDRWYAAEQAAAAQSRTETEWIVGSLLDDQAAGSPLQHLQRVRGQLASGEEKLAGLVSVTEQRRITAEAWLSRCWMSTEPLPVEPPEPVQTLGAWFERCEAAAQGTVEPARQVHRKLLPRLFAGLVPWLVFVILSAAVAGGLWLGVTPDVLGIRGERTDPAWIAIAVGAGVLPTFVLMLILHALAQSSVSGWYSQLCAKCRTASASYARWQKLAAEDLAAAEEDFENRHGERSRQRRAALAKAEADCATQAQSLAERYQAERGRWQADDQHQRSTLLEQRIHEFRTLDAQIVTGRYNLALRQQSEAATLDREHQQRLAELDQQLSDGLAALAERWSRASSQLSQWALCWGHWQNQTAPPWVRDATRPAGNVVKFQTAAVVTPTEYVTDLPSANGFGTISITAAALIDHWRRQHRASGPLAEQPIPAVTVSQSSRPLGAKSAPSITAPSTAAPSPSLEMTASHGDDLAELAHSDPSLITAAVTLAADSPLRRTLCDWQLPAVWEHAQRTGLLLLADQPASRAAANQLLQGVMLRLLTQLPPGQVRFTIIDPAGLGAAFATFMHLADTDELLVTQRIWTEPHDIEQRLADLSEHMETVLQMYLRNEYASLAEYNREAGEIAEPYRVLVLAGCPQQLTDVAVRRLWSIVANGARCGVIPLISFDASQPLPRGFTADQLAEQTTALDWNGNRFVYRTPALRHWPIVLDPLPAAGEFSRILQNAAEAAAASRRVEVPFDRVAPQAGELWTRSAARGVDVPIGRAGALKNQSVQLGQGTAQHVLIAGKTGSGKSTLLHALITNAALFYSPDELAFYLIDFKKGVEFQAYARGRLPHARVIGMESDREFGVSVLERLDAVLQERSATFRAAGVNDLPSFRQARPQEVLPRILFIVDEFQEFFVEDDPLAQSAALLLDRLIRQGRAFGVHVILGSQTLAGAYSLARSTLGQIGVRIALQSSETDAHLVLSEENSAARLLTRPGEAIYNDANGLPAGNHHFQVVWLDDRQRDAALTRLTSLTATAGSPDRGTIVFEGHRPADRAQLARALAAQSVAAKAIGEPAPTASGIAATAASPAVPIAAANTITAWLGEAVSLRGPLGLDFPFAPGAHLLVVGQDENSALGLMTAAAESVVSQAGADDQFWLWNGSPQPRSATVWQQFAQSPTGSVKAFEMGDLTSPLQALVDEVRQRDGRPGPRRWVCLFDLGRFRALRKKEDDFGGFSRFDAKAPAAPADLLAELLRDGPAVGVHVWLWCDGMNTVQRWLSREMQGQLENRVALPMSPTDSSALLDSPVAGRLGAYRAWLLRGDRGVLEKFRPYGLD